ncbi:MAG: hypothetical protein ROR55_21035 [Devosia sp.]
MLTKGMYLVRDEAGPQGRRIAGRHRLPGQVIRLTEEAARPEIERDLIEPLHHDDDDDGGDDKPKRTRRRHRKAESDD